MPVQSDSSQCHQPWPLLMDQAVSVVSPTAGTMYLDFVTWATVHIFLFPRALQKALSAAIIKDFPLDFPLLLVFHQHMLVPIIYIIFSALFHSPCNIFWRCKSVNSLLPHFKAETRNYGARSDVF